MSITAQPTTRSSEPKQQPLPDTGEMVPKLSWPIVGIFTAALTLFAASSWAAVGDMLPLAVTIAANAVAIFVMFTVLHDASHYSISSRRWVNRAFGRVAMLFVSPLISFPGWGFIHIEHHRHTNDDDHDPDHFTCNGPWWQLPFRWAAMDAPYLGFYMHNYKRRPRREVAESGVLLALALALIATTLATGSFWLLVVIYLIPERIAVAVLGWWFAWLPHHGLEETQTENRYRATRVRVGLEWLLTPLMLSQNYHLVHHLHPSVPFYRYLKAWRRNEEAYLERDPAIATAFGRELSPDQLREWKQLNRRLKALPVRMPNSSAASHAVFHKIPVQRVDRLTDDSVAISFAVPEELREQFQFTAGQHLTVRTDLGGQGVRRNYSICSPATSDELQIAVKHIPHGAFSTFARERLGAGDTLELMTPTGRFGTPLDPLASKHYVAIAAGSGITPILSLARTTLELEADSRFTLIYGNRTRSSTMFADELDELESRYADRLEILHIRSREAHHTPSLTGRIDREKLERWLSSTLAPDTVDEWFLCGPIELITSTRDTLADHGVDPDRIHLELFFGYGAANGQRPQDEYGAAEVTIRLAGGEQTVELSSGETILEATLGACDDAPYACMGGACGTCKAKLIAGSVEMEHNFALGQADLDAGYVLTCQSHPTTPDVTIDYDA
jgi:ring-1,2-phenylacetyl-CoA epoxidase subunit PaaE